jgi:hypothetical protein
MYVIFVEICQTQRGLTDCSGVSVDLSDQFLDAVGESVRPSLGLTDFSKEC